MALAAAALASACYSVPGSGAAADAGVDVSRPLDGPTPGRDVSQSSHPDSGPDASHDATVHDAPTTDSTIPRDVAKPDDARRPDADIPDATPPDADARLYYPDAETPDADAAPFDGGAFLDLVVSPGPLFPAFSPSIHDYYARCQNTTNPWNVAMVAAPGGTIRMLEPTSTAPSSGAQLDVSVPLNGAVVVRATSGTDTDDYWVRCLPKNFPTMTVTYYPDAGAPTAGYYLFAGDVGFPSIGHYAAVLDRNGVPVWYRAVDAGTGGPIDVDSILPGTISFSPEFTYTYASSSMRFELHQLEAGTTTYIQPSGSPLDSHELRVLPNGDFVMLSNPIEHGVNLSGLDGFGSNSDIVGCEIQEVAPDGGAVWQWHVLDHFDPVKDSTFPERIHVSGHVVAEVFHCNSVDVDEHGDLLVSARDMDSIFLVSRVTGAVVWKMGGSPYTKDGAKYVAVVNDPMGSFYRQHDVRKVGPSKVSMFDDQTSKTNPARAVVYDVDVDAGTATVAWQYAGTQCSEAQGSFRILDDGTRIIGWGVGGAMYRAFTEVDKEGNDLLDVTFAGSNGTYRAIKVPLSAFDIGLLRSSVTAGIPHDASTALP